MIFNIYEVFNTKIEAYERPIFSNYSEVEMIEACVRDFRASEDASKAKMLECCIFHVGTYDDNTGKFNLVEPNKILVFGDLEQNNGHDHGA